MRRVLRLLICVLAVSCAMPATTTLGAFTFLNVPDRRDYAFDSNGLLYVSTGGGSILRYSTQSQSYLSPFVIGGSPNGIDLSPLGQTLAVADPPRRAPTTACSSWTPPTASPRR